MNELPKPNIVVVSVSGFTKIEKKNTLTAYIVSMAGTHNVLLIIKLL